MGSYAAHLGNQLSQSDKRLQELEAENRLLKSMLDTFFTGNVPQGATLKHFVLAKYGRMRLDEQRKTPALLTKKD